MPLFIFFHQIKQVHIIASLLLLSNIGYTQIKLNANGEGKTYQLINSVFMEDSRNAVEVPDCSHKEFGNHISEIFDVTLNKYVFEFVIHIKNDNDRCKRFDRQRNEIKTNNGSSDIILATKGEKLNYRWKFKLAKGFKVSSRYTDVHQITYHKKSGNEPLFAFIARHRKGKKKFEIVHIDEDEKNVLGSIKLSKITGKWVVVDQTISYDKNGTYSLKLSTLDGKTILNVQQTNIQTWYDNMIYARPKWGIYRSLKKAEELRDEKLYFADFEINNIE